MTLLDPSSLSLSLSFSSKAASPKTLEPPRLREAKPTQRHKSCSVAASLLTRRSRAIDEAAMMEGSRQRRLTGWLITFLRYQAAKVPPRCLTPCFRCWPSPPSPPATTTTTKTPSCTCQCLQAPYRPLPADTVDTFLSSAVRPFISLPASCTVEQGALYNDMLFIQKVCLIFQ